MAAFVLPPAKAYNRQLAAYLLTWDEFWGTPIAKNSIIIPLYYGIACAYVRR